MKTRVLTFLFAVLILATIVPAAAQDEIDLSETFVFDSGASFNYPAGWKLDEKSAYVVVSKQQEYVLFVDFRQFEVQGIKPDTNLTEELSRSFRALFRGLTFDAKKAEDVEIDDREAVRYPFVDDQGRNAILFMIRFSDGTFGLALAGANSGEVNEELSLAIISTYDSLGDMATEESVTTGECRVSTRERDTVKVHVGPGENRAIYTFLPAGKDFQVLGQNEAADGSLWWELDRAEVAPSAAAAEAWVAQDDVTAKGECAAPDDETPTVIPPTPTPSS